MNWLAIHGLDCPSTIRAEVVEMFITPNVDIPEDLVTCPEDRLVVFVGAGVVWEDADVLGLNAHCDDLSGVSFA